MDATSDMKLMLQSLRLGTVGIPGARQLGVCEDGDELRKSLERERETMLIKKEDRWHEEDRFCATAIAMRA